jgi:HK97 family phage portal protein
MGTDLILPSGDVVPVRDRRSVAEHRDPRGATQLLSWQSPNLPQVDAWNATQAWRLGVLANVIAYRCIQLRARSAASVPLVAGRRLNDAKTINESAAITKLLGPPPGGPAPKLSASKLIRWTMAQKIVTGRRAWEIETDKQDRPVAFWPMVSADLKATPSIGTSEWFRLFTYGRADAPVRFTPDQVFYGWEPSGLDFRQAESELQSARFDLSLVTLCDQYGIGFLRNNAVPAAIITTTAFPNDAARRAFLRNWEGEFGGPANAGRVALNEVGDDGDGPVGDSINVQVLGLSAKDAQLVQQRKEAMAEVAISLGVPWSKLDASGRTFDNADSEDRDFWENTILPDLVDLQDDINMQLAPRLGSDVVWFDLTGVRVLRRKVQTITQTVGAPSLVQSQIMTVNEARDDYGLEPVDGGDRMMTAEEIAAISPNAAGYLLAPEPVAPAVPPSIPKALPAAADDPSLNADKASNRARQPEVRVADPEQQEQRRALLWRQSDAAVRTLESRWVRAWRRLFTRQEDATIARLTGKRGRQLLERRDGEPAPLIDPAAIFDVTFWTTAASELGVDLYDDTATAALGALAARFAISFDLHAPWVEQFIEQRAQQLAGQVTQTTYDAIRTQMTDAVGLGESIDDIATRIRAVFAQANDVRSTTIARTEVISAYNGAAVQGAATLPANVVAGQEWIATRDARTREAHASADGQIVAVGQPFDLDGMNAAYPGDPSLPPSQSINCRCAVAFLTPDEFALESGRAPRFIDKRVALSLIRLAARSEGVDFITWRRAAEEVAA